MYCRVDHGIGVSRLDSPEDQSVRVSLTCHNVKTNWILDMERLQKVCKKCARVLDGAARRKEATRMET